MLARVGTTLFFLANALAAYAVSVTSPTRDTTWQSGQVNTVTWSSVSTDPEEMVIMLVNNAHYPNQNFNLGTVQSSAGSLDTDISISSDLPTDGWQIYFNGATSQNQGSLAQSEQFDFEGSDSTLAASTISGGIYSSTSASSTSSSTATPSSSSTTSSSSSSSSSTPISSSITSSISSSASSSVSSSSASSSGSISSADAKTVSASSNSTISGFSTSTTSASSSAAGNSSSSSYTSYSGAVSNGVAQLSVAACMGIAALMLIA
ncbi:conserved fungal cell surface protein, Kre9/Knh1 family, Knh2 [Schizosaccharomyces pombe]|uniref:UPF0619 GPI-anchored membrane protein C1322.10 n=1 Tax=Schizosaccharomyces pombe (strain 972 / ATCC 24843) TaxID=284812 RepID=YCDA_SCHPO|nr:cell wall protein Pwp1 [Schizosaccharomyces pombe]O94549.1 RecName: Full=UPF0619 GPI-anchored membrane protein C1322.10; Flags: Precursor [Schizosaccharomyces pombe 972h-]CAA22863.1 cell wall protein Pwp1 [Schizosaccharomyces pombe]|eukprot:NP_588138.1 cell wall protein Pwp1 [Schizosaccharomyces pombe]